MLLPILPDLDYPGGLDPDVLLNDHQVRLKDDDLIADLINVWLLLLEDLASVVLLHGLYNVHGNVAGKIAPLVNGLSANTALDCVYDVAGILQVDLGGDGVLGDYVGVLQGLKVLSALGVRGPATHFSCDGGPRTVLLQIGSVEGVV